MRYLSRFSYTESERIKSIVETHWGMIGGWVNLIASACYPFPEVMQAFTEPMFIFPLEGLPGERYFPGTNVMDAVEEYAQELLRHLFGLGDEYRATIQPHSGTQANQIAFNAVLQPDDTVLSLRPAEGGHISHTVLVGRRNRVVYYSLAPDGTIDEEGLRSLAGREKPKLIIAGGSGYPRQINFAPLGKIARDTGAYLLADVSHTATFIAARLHAPVIPHADFVTFNMMKGMRGPAGGILIYRSSLHRNVARALFPGTQGGPIENVLFAKLVALEKLTRMDLIRYAESIVRSATVLAGVLRHRGLKIVTDGTDSHLLLVDLSGLSISGIAAEKDCERYHVLLNRNLVPGDRRKPAETSGVRIGSCCVTILGYSTSDLELLGNWLADRLLGIATERPEDAIDYLTKRYNQQLLPDLTEPLLVPPVS